MLIKKNVDNNIPAVTIGGITIEKVGSLEYLGSRIKGKWPDHRNQEENRAVFMKLKHFLSNNNLILDLKRWMVKFYIFSTLLYGMEAWTIKENDIK